jgi:uncharacterized protein (DUF433 family)
VVDRNLLKSRLDLKKEVETMLKSIVNKDPEILGGTPVFVGTRVPVRILFEHLEAGDSLDDFLDSFPTVSRKQATQLLDFAMKQIIEANEAAA